MATSGRVSRCVRLAALLAGLALACGGEGEPPAAAGEPAAAPASPASAGGGLGGLDALYEWDPVNGSSRNLSADVAACRSRMTSDGLPGVAEHMECMRGRGWRTLKPQS